MRGRCRGGGQHHSDFDCSHTDSLNHTDEDGYYERPQHHTNDDS